MRVTAPVQVGDAPASPASRSGRRRARGGWAHRAGLALVLIGATLVLVPGGYIGYGAWQEQQLTQQWHQIITTEVPPPVDTVPPAAVAGVPAAVAAPAQRPVVTSATRVPIAFAIRVPKIGYYSAVLEGVGLGQLASGPGHYPSTPYPGHEGVVGIAAHNSYWLRFGDLKAGDKIVLETRSGTFTYSVTGTRIVAPDDRTVFAQQPGYRLTLTTCWPLWAGALADRRLAIFATEDGGVA